jgi:hypothetical protein
LFANERQFWLTDHGISPLRQALNVVRYAVPTSNTQKLAQTTLNNASNNPIKILFADYF